MRINNTKRAIINNTPYTLAKHSTMLDDMENVTTASNVTFYFFHELHINFQLLLTYKA